MYGNAMLMDEIRRLVGVEVRALMEATGSGQVLYGGAMLGELKYVLMAG
jgi:hypothetical protein